MSKIIDLERHVSVTSAQTIETLCKPLCEMFDVHFFRYLKLYKNGKRIVLCNIPDAIRYAYTQGQWVNMWYDGNFPEFLKPGWYAWHVNRTLDTREIETKIESELISLLKVRHGVTFVQESKGYFEIFSFDTILNTIYQTDRALLLRFVYYFKEQAKKLINIGENELLHFPIEIAQVNPVIIAKPKDPNKIIKFLNDTKINRYYLGGEYGNAYLTMKEVTCIRWMMAGKTAEEIAIIENNSIKTIQHHIENIKTKFNCQKKTQIIKLVLDGMI